MRPTSAWCAGRWTSADVLVGVRLRAAACSPCPWAASLGADFVPRIDEGDIVVAIRRIPSIGFSEARRLDLAVQKVLKRFPEVETTLGMTGRAEVAVDPVGMDNTDLLVKLKPKEEWTTAPRSRRARREDEDRHRERGARHLRLHLAAHRGPHQRDDLGLARRRGDPAVRRQTSTSSRDLGRTHRAHAATRRPGAGDVRVERALGLADAADPRRPRAPRALRHPRRRRALGGRQATRQGRKVGYVFEGQRRYDLRVLVPPVTQRPEDFGRLPIGARDGQLVPLSPGRHHHRRRRARADQPPGHVAPAAHRREHPRPRPAELRRRRQGARRRRRARCPTATSITWGGQFENFERASARLAVVLPVALAIIFAMLFMTFGNVRYAARRVLGRAVRADRRHVALKLRGMPFSIPAAVGFIALCGIAVLNGVVMASEIRRRIHGRATTRIPSSTARSPCCGPCC